MAATTSPVSRDNDVAVTVCRDCHQAWASGIDSVESDEWNAANYRANVEGYILDDDTYIEDRDEYADVDWYWSHVAGCDLCESPRGFKEVADMFLVSI